MAELPRTSRMRASNEFVIHEILSLLYPNGKEVTNMDELNLRLHMVMGVLQRYGLAPKKDQS